MENGIPVEVRRGNILVILLLIKYFFQIWFPFCFVISCLEKQGEGNLFLFIYYFINFVLDTPAIKGKWLTGWLHLWLKIALLQITIVLWQQHYLAHHSIRSGRFSMFFRHICRHYDLMGQKVITICLSVPGDRRDTYHPFLAQNVVKLDYCPTNILSNWNGNSKNGKLILTFFMSLHNLNSGTMASHYLPEIGDSAGTATS